MNRYRIPGKYFLYVGRLETKKNLQTLLEAFRRYKEDRWFTTITPIYYKDRIVGTDSSTGLKSTRIRDKWIKIRIKYTGEKLVVINAIQSLLRLSYA